MPQSGGYSVPVAADIPALTALRERVRGASGFDRDLDADIWWRVALLPTGRYREKDGREETNVAYPEEDWRPYYAGNAPFLSGSLDACLALLERVLPNATWSVTRTVDGDYVAKIRMDKMDKSDSFADTPSMALLDAMLSALINQADPEARHD